MYDISFTNYNVLSKRQKKSKLFDFKRLFKSISAKYRNQRSKEFNSILNSSFSGKINFDIQFNKSKELHTDWIALIFNQIGLSLELVAVSNSTDLTVEQVPIMVVPNDIQHNSKELLELIDWDIVENNYQNIIKFQ